MMEHLKQNRVDTTIASAGTGKTYRLVEQIVEQVLEGMPPERILAATFTKKAAAELAGRIRAKLIEEGRPDLASAMLSARIGTVNSVCGSLISEFAFELGRSPIAEVVAEDRRASMFDRATGRVMELCGPAITEIAERFGLQARSYALHGRTMRGWQDEVRRAVDLARSNGIPAEKLAHCATRSAEGLGALLPDAIEGETIQSLDAALAAAITQCNINVQESLGSLKKGTLKNDVPAIEKAVHALGAGDRLAWPVWAKLSKLGAIKADKPMFADVIAAACSHHRHPGLRQDIEVYTGLIFDCAARCMTAYAKYKSARGLLDFVDQEMLALRIIDDPANSARLQELIGAVFVDEFQDSSPIQIAIFAALSRLAERNLWVGDPKQSIYGFRDADPAMTSAAAAAITKASGGATGYLRQSYRTRPQLTDFINAAISPNMRRVGMIAEEIEFDGCVRTEDPIAPAALSFWPMTGKKREDRIEMLAGRIAGLLSDTTVWSVSLKEGGSRAARGGDIAILCRGNAQVGDLANALSRRNVQVAVERSGLLLQPEIEFALAAFRWIADASDTLALAELARLATDDDVWFTSVFTKDARSELAARLPFTAALAAIRDRTQQLTPSEVLDALLHAEPIMQTVISWGCAEQRLQNIEALRNLLDAYQDEQRAERQAVTLVGACEWIALRKDSRQPQSRHPDAVNILTYHGAKGLEWPIVILTELDAPARGSPFGMIAEDETAPDWNAPLAARVLRFWPWPYGNQLKDVGLDVSAPASAEGVAALEAELLERTRLLYVGLTRARDHLGLATTGGALRWLEELRDDAGKPLIVDSVENISVGQRVCPARPAPEVLAIDEVTAAALPTYTKPAVVTVAHPALRIRPSEGSSAKAGVNITRVEVLGGRIPLLGDPDLQLVGEAVHGFFAADNPKRDRSARLEQASAALERWCVPQLTDANLVEMSDRLWAFVSKTFGVAPIMREWPVHAEEGLQIISGRLDLLIDLGDGYAIVDHKSFPGSMELDQARLQTFAGQVSLYARALGRVTGRTRFEYWVHQPIVGTMTMIDLDA